LWTQSTLIFVRKVNPSNPNPRCFAENLSSFMKINLQRLISLVLYLHSPHFQELSSSSFFSPIYS
jgi:hypothetical protein